MFFCLQDLGGKHGTPSLEPIHRAFIEPRPLSFIKGTTQRGDFNACPSKAIMASRKIHFKPIEARNKVRFRSSPPIRFEILRFLYAIQFGFNATDFVNFQNFLPNLSSTG